MIKHMRIQGKICRLTNMSVAAISKYQNSLEVAYEATPRTKCSSLFLMTFEMGQIWHIVCKMAVDQCLLVRQHSCWSNGKT
jgi:hypothetical protein